MASVVKFSDAKASPADYLPPAPELPPAGGGGGGGGTPDPGPPTSVSGKLAALISYLTAAGLVYDPWQVAAYITAIRTKPFVILAGISGTGKTKLPRLVAEATGAEFLKVPVRPDWTDSSELLGYERITGEFVPGVFLAFAKKAMENPAKQFFFLLDEMNIARVEHYFAEILSHIEERRPDATGRVVSGPLLSHLASGGGDAWRDVRLPDNLCIVGAVNMDESTQGFSKKVLDRAFVIEFSTVDLASIPPAVALPAVQEWISAEWKAAALSLGSHPQRANANVAPLIEHLITINGILERIQMQFGYRLRDEVIMFCLAAEQCRDHFLTADQGAVTPFDLAVGMKILPRIQGGGLGVKKVLEEFTHWSAGSSAATGAAGDAASAYPFTEQRLQMMSERLSLSGFTSYWL
jgi:hypothetical protein